MPKPEGKKPSRYDENPEWTAEDFRRARPAYEMFPDLFEGAGSGRDDVEVTLRLNRQLVERFDALSAHGRARLEGAVSRAIGARRFSRYRFINTSPKRRAGAR